MSVVEKRAILWKLGLCILLVVIPASPQQNDPTRRSARFGYAGGQVSLTPAGLQDSTPAELNRPITTGDRFWSGAEGRGELQTDNAALRFGARTNLIVQELDDQSTQVQLTAGSLLVRLHTLAPGESFEVDTPQVSVNFTRRGAYHVEADDQATLVSVHSGEAEVFKADGATTSVRAGQQARIAGPGNPQLDRAGALDAFDTWCIERDRREDLAKTANYVSRDIPGYADLDEHGIWRNDDRYGAVWFPSNMDADWAPYRSGHYIWNDTFGMNWVDGASWGFGPLHYGRWVKLTAGWGWVPGKAGKASGSFGIRPFYAPALVSWAKFAPGAVGPGAVLGWFPLAPGEAWVPGFRASADYLARLNLSSTDIADRTVFENPEAITMNYLNRDVAMTGERYAEVVAGGMVGRDYVRIPQAASEHAVVGAQPVLEPTREARLGPKGPAAGAPPGIANRPVVARRAPSPPPAAFVPRSPPPAPAPAPASSSASASAARPAHQAAPHHEAPPVSKAAPPASKNVEVKQAKPGTAPSSGISGGLKGIAGSVKNAGNKVIHGSSKSGNKQAATPPTGSKPKQAKPAKPAQKPKPN